VNSYAPSAPVVVVAATDVDVPAVGADGHVLGRVESLHAANTIFKVLDECKAAGGQIALVE